MDTNLNLAILDNTFSAKKLKSGYARGEKTNRFVPLQTIIVDGIKTNVDIIDPFGFPLNPLRNKHGLLSGLDPARAVKVLSRLKKYDLILSIGESSAASLLLFRKIFPFKTPVLILDPALDYSWKARRHLLDFVLPRADAVLVRGKNQCQFLDKQYAGACQCEVIYHAINTEFYEPLAIAKKDYIFTIGNDTGRDFDTLIAAVKDMDIPVILKTNEISINQSILPNNVQLMSERVSFDELKQLYAKARLVVVPLKNSVHASGVNSVLEASAMARPMIVSSSEGIMDYFVPDETGISVKPLDPKGLADAIKWVIDNPDNAEQLGYNAKIFVEKHFTTERYIEGLVRILYRTYLRRKH
jgi:glycosyltransferase involved in cell wall biosynthesis